MILGGGSVQGRPVQNWYILRIFHFIPGHAIILAPRSREF